VSRSALRDIVRRTPLYPIVRARHRIFAMPGRLRLALGYQWGTMNALLRWVWSSTEHSNFGYDLTASNKRHLSAMLSHATGRPRDVIEGFMRELNDDRALRSHVRSTLGLPNDTPIFGRRMGWYALVRAVKPRTVVETGVDQGLGSCVLCAALLRNGEEGHPGRYVGTDINPRAGVLMRAPYDSVGAIRIGDSATTLQGIVAEGTRIDLFINDSEHSAEYERREYRIVEPALGHDSWIIADNAHATDELLAFADRTSRLFLFFKEQPANHWYPGAGIGLAFGP